MGDLAFGDHCAQTAEPLLEVGVCGRPVDGGAVAFAGLRAEIDFVLVGSAKSPVGKPITDEERFHDAGVGQIHCLIVDASHHPKHRRRPFVAHSGQIPYPRLMLALHRTKGVRVVHVPQ